MTTFKAADPADLDPPVVSITWPPDGGEITAPTAFTGTVADDGLDYYRLEYAKVGTGQWIPIVTGHHPVEDGDLGYFDPTLLKNGIYEVRLAAVDLNGNSSAVHLTTMVEGQLKAGINQMTFTDLQTPVSGIDITVNRTYNSGDRSVKDFGHGWSVAVHDVCVDENRRPGDDWYEVNTGSMIHNWEIQSDQAHFVAVTFPDGRTEVFDVQVAYTDPVYRTGYEVRVSFVPRSRTKSTLQPLDFGLLYYNAGRLYDYDTLEILDPSGIYWHSGTAGN